VVYLLDWRLIGDFELVFPFFSPAASVDFFFSTCTTLPYYRSLIRIRNLPNKYQSKVSEYFESLISTFDLVFRLISEQMASSQRILHKIETHVYHKNVHAGINFFVESIILPSYRGVLYFYIKSKLTPSRVHTSH